MNEMTVTYNGQSYIAIYNEQTGYYEVDLQAPIDGGIYNADINFTDVFGQSYEDTQVIQVLAKEQLKLEMNKVFMWIFSYKDFSVKDIVELSDYEINIDEETNANTIIKVLKKTTAKAKDIVAVKKNNEIVYWGKIENISNEDGKKLYEYTVEYITNLFDRDIILNAFVNQDSVDDATYRIKEELAPDKYVVVKDSNVEINEKASEWKIEKIDDYYIIKNTETNKVLTAESLANEANVIVEDYKELDTQKWQIVRIYGTRYKIKIDNFVLTLHMGDTENGANIKLYEDLENYERQRFIFMRVDESIIKETGVEDYIAKKIYDNFTNNDDTFINLEYLQIDVKTHTAKQTSVTNVQDNIFNLHTWMANCTQNYDIVYDFTITNKKLTMTIENKTFNKELIDTQAQAISNYTEVFETDVASKVVVLTSTDTYILYLLNDRTTTTDKTNTNRADGRIETVYTEKYEEANQKALDVIKSNSYNHNITFNYYDRLIKVGTPIAIKTKESIILDTYISAVKITKNKFIEYICGNIRIKFIDKLLKERRK